MGAIRKAAFLSLLLVSSELFAAITFVGAGTAVVGTSGGSPITPTLHASTAENDLIVCSVAWSDDDASESIAISGYTQLGPTSYTASSGRIVFGKIAGSSESDPSVVATGFGAGDIMASQCGSFRGTDLTIGSVVAHSAQDSFIFTGGTANEIDHPALPITTANTVVIVVGGKRVSWSSVAVLNTDALGWAEIGKTSTSAGDDVGLVWDYVVQTTAASISAGSFVIIGENENDAGGAILLSLKEAAASSSLLIRRRRSE